MSKIAKLCTRARSVALLLGLTAVLPALAICPLDTFVDQANFSHVDDDPTADGDGDRFGNSVGTNGRVMAVGMIGHPSHDTHHVYLYQRDATAGQWSYLKRLDQPGFSVTNDHYGEVLAVDGDTLVVGANLGGPDSAHFAGAVYVYQRDAGGSNTWGTTQSLYYAGINGLGYFGESLDIHRNRMVVGARKAGDGRALIYERSSPGANYTTVAELLPPAADLARINGGFARQVTLYGDIVVLSDPDFRNVSDTFSEGRVWVYARDQGGAGQWGLVTTLQSPPSTPPNGTNRFGHAISIWGSDDQTRGETIAVSNHEQAGHVFLFGRDTGGADNWGQIVDLVPGDSGSGEFGSSLHLHSNELLVGDSAADGNEAAAGAVYVYHQQTGGANSWGQAQKFYAQNPPQRSNYGFALDWSDGVAVIGDPLSQYGSEFNVGRAYILFDDLIFCDPFE